MLVADSILPKLGRQYVDLNREQELKRFLYHESRLLDAEEYEAWLGLMAEDIHYWMPVQENRDRKDKAGTFSATRMAFFDDNYQQLKTRIDRFGMHTAWSENPRTRHVHSVSNIEVFETANPEEFEVQSVFINCRNARERDQDIIMGRRVDLIRCVKGDYYLAKRLIILSHNVLLSKNINTFF